MSGDHNMYGDGTVYRGERSKDSAAPTYTLHELAHAKGVPRAGAWDWREGMKLTPWFHPTDTPERVGVYQRIRWNDDDPFYSYWDGRTWWPSGVTPDGALQQYAAYLSYGVPRWVSQVLQWRGVSRV